MTIPNGSKPDLVFYYSLLLPTSVINKTINGKDVIQTATGVLTADPEYQQVIGKFAFNITVYNAINPTTNEPNNDQRIFEVTGTNVYFLPEGTISNSINLNFYKDNNGNFIVPSDQENVYQILSGSGDFLNYSGFIVQLTDGKLGREIQVYFDK